MLDWNIGNLIEGKTVWNTWAKRAGQQQQKALPH